MFHFTIRDVLWLMVVVALVVGWLVDHRIMQRTVTKLEEAAANVAMKWADDVGHPVKYSLPSGQTWTVTPQFP